ncbi:hypothetical protein C8F01DRAFT_776775 [Mycena amicta]|nr:hypothetical protein C8F01DRAFT_776775 [Mycena amicta]
MRTTTTNIRPAAATSKDVHVTYSRTTYIPGRRAIRNVESPNELFGTPSVPPSPNDNEASFAQSPPSSSSSPSSSSRSKRSWSPTNGHDDDSDDDSSSKRLKSVSPSPQGPRNRLPRTTETFDDFRQHDEIAFVDKMPHALRLPEEFRYILVRPPRFGKPAFLSTASML